GEIRCFLAPAVRRRASRGPRLSFGRADCRDHSPCTKLAREDRRTLAGTNRSGACSNPQQRLGPVRTYFKSSFAPFLTVNPDDFHPRHRARDASAKTIDQENTAGAFEDPRFAAGRIAQGRQIRTYWRGLRLEQNFFRAIAIQQCDIDLHRYRLADIA